MIGTLAPLALAVYYWLVWYKYLNPANAANNAIFGLSGASGIYYSWFVLAAIGLNLSQYGFEGVEASMLMKKRWSPKHAMQLMAHSEHSWAGPGGWLRVLKSWLLPQKKLQRTSPSPLWIMLALPSLLVYVALPLSGLTMNFGLGYLSPLQNASMVGFNNASWNSRLGSNMIEQANIDWSSAATASIPAFGVVYTPSETDRSSSSYLSSLPNNLPANESLPGVFLTPQASVPIQGNSWGLALSYNCSIVTKFSAFTLLKYRDPHPTLQESDAGTPSLSYPILDNTAWIEVYNETYDKTTADNLQAVLEVAYDYPDRQMREAASLPASSDCYFPLIQGNETAEYPGLDDPQVIEIALWQNLSTTTPEISDPPSYNTTLDFPIPELFGAYSTARTEYTKAYQMPAIGLRCISTSAVGTADVDGIPATFSNFQRSNTPRPPSGAQCAPRLLLGVQKLLFHGAEWLGDMYSSVGKPTLDFVQDSEDDFTGSPIPLQTSLLQASQLCESLLQAFSIYAAELVYNHGSGYLTAEGAYAPSSFVNANVTSYTLGTILTTGVVAPIAVATLLSIWAVFSIILGVCFGFRRRWAEVLDGYTMFKIGGDWSTQIKNQQDFDIMQPPERCAKLKTLPGMIGDAQPNSNPGHISLVSRHVAKKNKRY